MNRSDLIVELAAWLKQDPSGERAAKILYKEGTNYSEIEKDEIWKVAEEKAYPHETN